MIDFLRIIFISQVPSVEVNALIRSFKMKPLLFPVCLPFSLDDWSVHARLCGSFSSSDSVLQI